MQRAASVGDAIRPNGISSLRAAMSSEVSSLFMSVSIAPKAMALTEILLGASSFANALVKLLMAPLVAE